MKKLVSYVYEHGSRGRDVVLKFLKNFCGCISTDGYVAYSIFDDAEKYPNIMHIGCWIHALRLYVEAYETEKINCGAVINDIGELFGIELNGKLMKAEPDEIKKMRQESSRPILARLYAKVN